MKKIISLLIAVLLACTSSFAQEAQAYAMTKKGASIQYSYKYGKKQKLMCYIVTTVHDNKLENGKNTVSILWTMLNKKEKPSKSAAFAGFGDGLLSSITLENGAYYMTMDLGLATGVENRHGYILKMPATLNVGDTIEGGTLRYENKYMGMTLKCELTYSGFKVVEEVDLETPAGKFHCLKLTGNVKGKFQGMDIDDDEVMYIAPGMGIVRQEVNYLGEKKPIVLEAYKVSGL